MQLGTKAYFGIVVGLLLLLVLELWGYAGLTPLEQPVGRTNTADGLADSATVNAAAADYREGQALLRRRLPSAPSAPTASMTTTNSILVNWSEPLDSGRGPIDSYAVSVNGENEIVTRQTSLVMERLSSGVLYSFRVRAHGEMGWSPDSAASVALTLPKIRPGLEGVVWTFDDCEYAAVGNVFHLLEVLQKHGVQPGHAIFFYIGWCYYAHLDEIAKIKADGYEVGNHTRTHAYLPGLSYAGIQSEIAGGPPNAYWFRPPYGAYDSRVSQAVAAAGLHMMLWNKTAGDTSSYKPSLTCQSILNLFWSTSVGGNDNVLAHMFHIESTQALDAYLSGSHTCNGYTG